MTYITLIYYTWDTKDAYVQSIPAKLAPLEVAACRAGSAQCAQKLMAGATFIVGSSVRRCRARRRSSTAAQLRRLQPVPGAGADGAGHVACAHSCSTAW